MVHRVGFVQDDPNLIVMPPDRLNGLLELVRDVQLVSIEDQYDPEAQSTTTIQNAWATYLPSLRTT